MERWGKEKAVLQQAVRKAGEIILKYRGSAELESADQAANQILFDAIHTSFPKDIWFSEETEPRPQELTAARTWVVDPLDGTREFREGLDEFSVSVALLEDRLPQIAAVYNPVRGEFFLAVRGEGLTLNDQPAHARARDSQKPTILKSHRELLADIFQQDTGYALKPMGSIAYRLSLVGGGLADAALAVKNRNLWDVAAGVLVAQEGGAIVCGFDGAPVSLTHEGVEGILAIVPSIKDIVLQRLFESRQKFRRQYPNGYKPPQK